MAAQLPPWYVEQAEDYLSVLRHSADYSRRELMDATRTQRLAEYRLMRERSMAQAALAATAAAAVEAAPPLLAPLQKYDVADMSAGWGATSGSRPDRGRRRRI